LPHTRITHNAPNSHNNVPLISQIPQVTTNSHINNIQSGHNHNLTFSTIRGTTPIVSNPTTKIKDNNMVYQDHQNISININLQNLMETGNNNNNNNTNNLLKTSATIVNKKPLIRTQNSDKISLIGERERAIGNVRERNLVVERERIYEKNIERGTIGNQNINDRNMIN
jgi:hypothetical protein